MHAYIRKAAIALAVAGAAFGVVGSASALTIGFTNITNNGSPDAAAQLQATVTDGAGANAGGALFKFEVVSTAPNPGATIAEIYFDDRPAGDDPAPNPSRLFVPPPTIVANSAGVSFTAGSASPPDLPGGNTVGFSVTSMLVAEASGNNATGIQFGEFLTLRLAYETGKSFATLLGALTDGSFRIGLHVRSLGTNNGGSDSFVSTPIPLPLGAWLALTAAGGLVMLRRRRAAVAA